MPTFEDNRTSDRVRGLTGRTSSFWKAKFVCEWLLAIGLLVTLVPLLLLLALLVKVSSRGPVFHVDSRTGRNGRVFRLYKFRSMKVGVAAVLGPDGKVLTFDDDVRLTPAGRFLRLGFDELPQLWNIIRGDMCLIGPRPDIPEEKARYTPRQRRRLGVLPGITGLAQVLGGRELNNAQNYELDVRYIERSTALTDLAILLLTLPYSLGARGLGRWFLPRYMEGIEDLE